MTFDLWHPSHSVAFITNWHSVETRPLSTFRDQGSNAALLQWIRLPCVTSRFHVEYPKGQHGTNATNNDTWIAAYQHWFISQYIKNHKSERSKFFPIARNLDMSHVLRKNKRFSKADFKEMDICSIHRELFDLIII